nr:bifunctional nuclease domain-containing protein [Acinetobacter baumannii]
MGCIAGVSKESTAVQSCWTWVKRAFILPIREDGIFYSNIITEQNGQEVILDARTSDAVAIAVRFNAPIFVFKDILDKAGVNLSVVEDAKQATEQSLEEVIENFLSADDGDFTNEFAKYSKENLTQMLESAVLDEDYERAARIRDELRKRDF